MDLNKCSKCKQDLVIGGSGTICCVNDDCEIEVIGMIYDEPITIEEQGEKLIIPRVSHRRELLIAYEKNHYTPQEWALASKQCIEDIDNFLAINCG